MSERPDPRMQEIRDKQPGEITPEDAVYLDGHLAVDLFFNWMEDTHHRMENLLTPLVARGLSIVNASRQKGQKSLDADAGETLSNIVTSVMNIEMRWHERVREHLEWTQQHGRELVGDANYERIEQLLADREAEQNDIESLMEGTDDALRGFVPPDGETLL